MVVDVSQETIKKRILKDWTCARNPLTKSRRLRIDPNVKSIFVTCGDWDLKVMWVWAGLLCWQGLESAGPGFAFLRLRCPSLRAPGSGSPWILGSAGQDKGWEPCLLLLEPGVDRPSTLLVLLVLLVLLLPSCFCQGSPSCCGATCYCPEKKEVKEGLKFSSKPNT